MDVTITSIRKSSSGTKLSPIYAVRLLTDGKSRLCHALVRTRHAHAISFRERWVEHLLSNNFDQGRRLYKAIWALHRDAQAPPLPMRLGDLDEMMPAPEDHLAQSGA
jgi:hypothetical protein